MPDIVRTLGVARETGVARALPNVRVSQVAVEVLLQGPTKARVSQAAVEVLLQGPTTARVSQFAVEVLIANRVFSIGVGHETDQAQTLTWSLVSPGQQVSITAAGETDTALPLALSTVITLTPAGETDTAARLVDWLVIEPALELDLAVQLQYGTADARMTQVLLEVTMRDTSAEALVTQTFIEVLHQVGQDLHVWHRF